MGKDVGIFGWARRGRRGVGDNTIPI